VIPRLFLCALVALPACRSTPDPAPPRVDAAVREALRSDGEVRVIVALRPPHASDPSEGGAARHRAEIARIQDEVLSTLDPADFTLGHRFESVPALAGTVRSARGLRTLGEHPLVLRVDLDPEGGGGRGAHLTPSPGGYP
jgi:hypothetical protein